MILMKLSKMDCTMSFASIARKKCQEARQNKQVACRGIGIDVQLEKQAFERGVANETKFSTS